MTSNDNPNLIQTNQQKLTQYSSDLIKKGLNLANQIKVTEPSKAEEFFKKALEQISLGNYQGALENFEQALNINPDYYEVYVLRSSLIYTRLGNFQAVIKDCDQVLRLNPKNAEAYNNRGFAYASLGNYLEAIKNYDQALKIEPYFIQTYINRGLSYSTLQNYERAILDFNQVLQINPYNADAYNNRGFIYFLNEYYEDALEDFNQALKLESKYTKAYLNRGVTYINLGEYWKGIQDFSQAIKLDSEIVQEYFKNIENISGGQQLEVVKATIADSLLLQGTTYYEAGNYQEAIEKYNQSIYISPNYKAFYSRGVIRSLLGDAIGAIADCSQALHINPNHSLTYILRGKIRIDLENIQEGIKDLIQGFLLEGQSCFEVEDYQGAIEAYTQVLKLDPSNALAYSQRGKARIALDDFEGILEDMEEIDRFL